MINILYQPRFSGGRGSYIMSLQPWVKLRLERRGYDVLRYMQDEEPLPFYFVHRNMIDPRGGLLTWKMYKSKPVGLLIKCIYIVPEEDELGMTLVISGNEEGLPSGIQSGEYNLLFRFDLCDRLPEEMFVNETRSELVPAEETAR